MGSVCHTCQAQGPEAGSSSQSILICSRNDLCFHLNVAHGCLHFNSQKAVRSPACHAVHPPVEDKPKDKPLDQAYSVYAANGGAVLFFLTDRM